MASSNHQWQINSKTSDQTEALAEQLARNLKGREVIELVSDLGGGKTTFVRGLARGLGSTNTVNSPTFKISNVYHSPALTINHFDLYRLHESGLISYELAEVMNDPNGVTLIEWAADVADILPDERLTVHFEHTGEHSRHITFHYPTALAYLMEGLTS
jgi:tRNA threonylcarbamoyladenosine biosynthesis protein TsaE